MSDADDTRPRPHSADPLRPRPQYGEYASPEEQRAKIRVPDASAALSAGVTPSPPARPQPRRPAEPASAALSQRIRIDRAVTIGLLGFGLFYAVTTIPAYLAYVDTIAQGLVAAGIDAPFTNVEQGRLWGAVAAIVLGGMWLVTALASYLQLRRGRLAFWIPLVGGVVTAIVVAVCLAVPLVNDPGIVAVLMPTPSP